MDLVLPDIGLVFWTTISFLLLLVLLSKFAWKPITAALTERERSIEDALQKAEAAKDEMKRLTGENEQLLKDARAERDLILREGKKLHDQMVADAKDLAQKEGAKMIEKAKQEIHQQKALALTQVKEQVANLSLQIAEKVLRKQFDDEKKQNELIDELLKDVTLN